MSWDEDNLRRSKIRDTIEPLEGDPWWGNPNREGPYSQLPLTGSHEAGVGHALITLVEPHVGHESHYNRWYEDYHFFDGALMHPWMFAGRRWVAPYWLQPLRYPRDTPVLENVDDGKYLGTYWITKDRLDDHRDWTGAANARHRVIGHANSDRTTVFTTFNDSVRNVYRDKNVPRARYALHDPAAGIVLEVLDAPSREERPELDRWLLEDYLPKRVAPGGPVSLAMVFHPLAPKTYYHSKKNYEVLKNIANDDRRVTVLWFLHQDPQRIWSTHFSDEVENVAAGGHGQVSLVAPFIPAKMGTPLYEDQLRPPK
jgi:hypothetical protein